MALINCPECNKQISDKAAACPSCGCPVGGEADSGLEFRPVYQPVQTIEKTGKKYKAVTAFAVMAIFVGMFFCFKDCSSLGTTEAALTGPVIMGAGLLVYIANRITIWWHHE